MHQLQAVLRDTKAAKDVAQTQVTAVSPPTPRPKVLNILIFGNLFTYSCRTFSQFRLKIKHMEREVPQQTLSGPRKYSAEAVNARPPLQRVPVSALAESLAATAALATSTPIKADTAGSPDAVKNPKNQRGWINSLRNLQWPKRKPTVDPAGMTHQVQRALFPLGVPDTPPNQPPAPVEPAQPGRGTGIAAEAELLPVPDFGLIEFEPFVDPQDEPGESMAAKSLTSFPRSPTSTMEDAKSGAVPRNKVRPTRRHSLAS